MEDFRMGKIGMTELLVILGIALLLFGNRLPTMGKSLGESFRNFKKGLSPDEEKPSDSSQQNVNQSPQSNETNPHAHVQIESATQKSETENVNIESNRKSA